MTRLVHVTTTDMSLELLLGPQLRAFSDAGYEVIGMSAPGPYVEALERDGIAHVPLKHATRAMAPHRDVAALAEVVRQFRRLRPDIVHTHNPKPGLYGRVAARLTGVPTVVNTVHGLYAQPTDTWKRRTAVYTLERLAARCSDAELVQNPEDIAVLTRLGVPSAKLTVLGNGIDLDRFDPAVHSRAAARAQLGVGPDTVVCGAVGRLVREKGYPELIEAARRVAATIDFRLVIVGPNDPSKSDSLADSVVRQAEADGVVFLGLREDVESLYPGFDVYALASHREGFPRSAMEAAAMGLPIVATDIRGCRQVVDDGLSGLLVPVADSYALSQALEKLSGDRPLRERMGRAARAKALAEFDQRRVIATTLATYERVGARPAMRAA
jgi:glycosyltransferase involved in cell wall biosynthesis